MRQLVIKTILNRFSNGGFRGMGLSSIIFPKKLSEVVGREIEWEDELTHKEVKNLLKSFTDQQLIDVLTMQAKD